METDSAGSAAGRLDVTRRQIVEIDRRLMALVADRVRLAEVIGEAKRELGLPLRDFATEAEVLARYRQAASALGLTFDFADAMAGLLIGAAVQRQEERAWHPRSVSGLSAVIVGGAGKMGRWMRRFLEGQGHQVAVIDPSAEAHDGPAAAPPELADCDLVVVATPLAATAEMLSRVAAGQPRGLVLDIASLKSHLLGVYQDAVARGVRIASLHPMFGPDVKTLAGRVVAVCDCGDAQAVEEAAALFDGTAATLTRVPVAEHDRYMQVILGLSHLVSLLFATTVARAGHPPGALQAMASTTWLKQVRTAREVVSEDPELYHAIQHLNAHSAELFALLRDRLDHLEAATRSADAGLFVRLMEDARAFLGSERGVTLE